MIENLPVDGEIIGAEHHKYIRVYFQDTDAGQVVYHANYISFMERARSDFWRALKVPKSEFDPHVLIFVIAGIEIKYKRPALLDDLLLIKSKAISCSAARIVFHQTVWRDDTLLVEAQITASVVKDKKLVRMPAIVNQKVQELLSQE